MSSQDNYTEAPRQDSTKRDGTVGETGQGGRQLHGLLVSYKDDELNESIHSALKGKKRVHYRCMDVYSNFIAFGTSVGAIYLFRLATITHSSCKLAQVIPCDQGSIDVIKFLPGQSRQQQQAPSELLVAIGTSRGSLVLFQLGLFDEANVMLREIYRAEEFTKSLNESAVGIKLLEYDLDLLNTGAGSNNYGQPAGPFPRLYICDKMDRMFVLESSSINPAFRLLHSSRPAHVLSVNESTVHQVCVHRSQLLMSTDEKTHVFREQTNELCTIGKKQRKMKGFFGACYFNPNYKPARMLAASAMARSRANLSSSRTTIYSSATSIFDMENLLIFVARPKFTLWQVNNRLEVMFTQIFDSSIRATPSTKAIELLNVPINSLDMDDPSDIERTFADGAQQQQQRQYQETYSDEDVRRPYGPRSDHFEKLVPIFSTTLGNLLLCYTKQEIFIIDPTGARLIVWYCHDKPITQVCCNENEIFILSGLSRRQVQVDRMILLAPTQFVLELHRINRFNSLMMFVQMFPEQFRNLMALPLSGLNTITTEGGLLRNILWDTWREYSAHASDSGCERLTETDGDVNDEHDNKGQGDERFLVFGKIIGDIIDESRQLRQSIENISESRLLFMVSNENLERLCSEPYASMVSLDISIANLHTNHVVHFSQEALQRHKSIAKLSQSLMNLNKLKRSETESSLNINADDDDATDNKLEVFKLDTVHNKVSSIDLNKEESSKKLNNKQAFSLIDRRQESQEIKSESQQLKEPDTETNRVSSEQDNQQSGDASRQDEAVEKIEKKPERDVVGLTRCSKCLWPKPRAHLKQMHHSQQIQYNYIQENLLPSFEENIQLIEERAFKHGLWHLLLKCFAFENKLDDYITCCIMLDDVRLLNIERFVITRCSKDDLFDRVFEKLDQKLDLLANKSHSDTSQIKTNCPTSDTDGQVREHLTGDSCFKCRTEYEPIEEHEDDDDGQYVENPYSQRQNESDDGSGGDDISFTLMNLFKRSLLRKNADIRRAVKRLLQHPNLLNRSKIPADFYLQAVASQCATIRQAIF